MDALRYLGLIGLTLQPFRDIYNPGFLKNCVVSNLKKIKMMLLKTVRPNLFALFYIAVLRYCICGPVGDTSYHVGSNWEIYFPDTIKENFKF